MSMLAAQHGRLLPEIMADVLRPQLGTAGAPGISVHALGPAPADSQVAVTAGRCMACCGMETGLQPCHSVSPSMQWDVYPTMHLHLV